MFHGLEILHPLPSLPKPADSHDQELTFKTFYVTQAHTFHDVTVIGRTFMVSASQLRTLIVLNSYLNLSDI